VSGDLHVVHVRVVDGATGKPTPVRMRFQRSDGRRLAPLGRLREFPTGVGQDVGLHLQLDDRVFHYVDGACEIQLPADAFDLEIVKGPEFTPIERAITLGTGKMALRFVMERRQNLSAAGWYAGDCRSHELTPHAALVEGAAEGLTVVNLLAQLQPSSFMDGAKRLAQIEAFSGQEPCLSSSETAVFVNTFNVHPTLGRLALLNCHRPVYPLRTDEEGFEDWTLDDWCGQCHRKKGLVIWSEPSFWTDSFQEVVAPEGLAQVILGNVDAIEIAGPIKKLGPDPWTNWYTLLNAGVKAPLAGASGKESNQSLLGRCRTYAFVDPETPFTYSAWIEAVRAGRTVVSDGPFIDFTVDGQRPGHEFKSHAADQKLQVRGEVQCSEKAGLLELVGNGAVLATAASVAGESASLTAEVSCRGMKWLACRFSTHEGRFMAHTSAVYLAGGWIESEAKSSSELARIKQVLTRGREWSAGANSLRTSKVREGLVQRFIAAVERLQ
jgi:hypothetical protein